MRAIGYPRLGALGGLGNSLFQLASTVGVARILGRPVVLPESFQYRPFLSIPDGWFGDEREVIDAEDAGLLFWQLWGPDRPNRRWAKYGQNPEFFSGVADEIRAAFQPSARALAVMDSIPEPGDRDIAVHVRRSDYLTMPDHLPAQPAGYYINALRCLPGGDVDVYGDDQEWAEANIGGTWRAHHVEADECTDWLDLFLMARYRRLVIANSSYSWWAAWLSGGSVIAPRCWFGSKIDVPSPIVDGWFVR